MPIRCVCSHRHRHTPGSPPGPFFSDKGPTQTHGNVQALPKSLLLSTVCLHRTTTASPTDHTFGALLSPLPAILPPCLPQSFSGKSSETSHTQKRASNRCMSSFRTKTSLSGTYRLSLSTRKAATTAPISPGSYGSPPTTPLLRPRSSSRRRFSTRTCTSTDVSASRSCTLPTTRRQTSPLTSRGRPPRTWRACCSAS